MTWNIRQFFRRKTSADLEVIAFVQKAFGIRAQRVEYYLQALRHSSAATKITPGLKNSNERLEFLGDAILDSIVAHYLYNKYPTLPEGELTKMKSKVVRRENLNMIGYSLQLDQQLDLKLGNQDMHDSIVGNGLEAVIGAIYLDKGYHPTRDIVLRLLKQYGLDTRVHDDVDYKSKLHEWSQKYKRTLGFKVVSHINTGGASVYKIAVMIDDKEYGAGQGGSKKSAEQKAARQACEKIFGAAVN
ncbi:MAG: ribonuclease III [Flavobacteriales bacterium]|nr:ribonuclease III [Flavobacteriales bacterium]